MNMEDSNIQPHNGCSERQVKMRKKLTLFILSALICISGAVPAAPLIYNGTVGIEGKTVAPGQSFTIKLWLAGNDTGVTSLRIPLKFDSQYLTCTYVDFSGSIKDVQMTGYYQVNGGQVEISYIPAVVYPLRTITADSGLIATLYFTVSNEAPDVTISIDSVNEDIEFEQFGTTFHQWRRVEAAEQSGTASLIPTFTAGDIVVRQSTDVGDEIGELLPGGFALIPNYPNPFNPTTTILFTLPEKADIRLEVFNLLGQRVTTLADREFPAGNHEIVWDASGEASGVYFYRISADAESITRKMLLLK